MIKVKLKFSCLNASRFFLAEVMEGLLNALPLILYLFKYCFHDLVLVILYNVTLFLELSDFSLILLSIILEGRIQNWVMPEVETLHRVNGISYPSWKIWIIKSPTILFLYLISKQLFNLFKVKVIVWSKIPDDIFWSDKPIMIRV